MKLFVWDFHGVLEKGNEFAVREITNAVLEQYQYKERLSERKCLQLYGRKWYQYFEDLLPNESLDRYFELQDACHKYSEGNQEIIVKNISPNSHALDVVKKISLHHDQIIISNSSIEALTRFIKSVSLDRFFPAEKIFGTNAHLKDAVTKKRHILLEYLKGKTYEDIIFIGDSPEDVELTEVVRGKSYLYAHPDKPFKEAKADFKINDLREILKEL